MRLDDLATGAAVAGQPLAALLLLNRVREEGALPPAAEARAGRASGVSS